MATPLPIRASPGSVAYAALIFVPLHHPGLLAAALLQFTTIACVLAVLLVFLAYRSEIRELVAAAFQACAAVLLWLLPCAQLRRQPASRSVAPAEPFRALLFQRPPPRLA
ncbi:MAG TPA: hypothetical protein VME18_09315 [Acidobacteriaceae bacterium]|nr:hypothetical protein [Acidobacteriaceae bacterium]